MNKEKRSAAFLKVKHFAENRQKHVEFDLDPKVDRMKDMRDDLMVLKLANYETPGAKHSEIFMEKLEMTESQAIVLKTGNI